jgi:predicted nucleic acid-binding protein
MPVEFVDTNVLVYAYDQSAGEKYRSAMTLMERLWNSGDGVLCHRYEQNPQANNLKAR